MKQVNLGLKDKSVTELIAFAQHIVTKMTGNVFFPAPNPVLSKITVAASALQTAFDNAQGGGTLLTAIVHQKRGALETLLGTEGNYVEGVANDPANSVPGPDVIILSAGMEAKRVTPRQKQVFTVERGKLPGTVILLAERVVRGIHEWSYSLDLSNANGWIEVDPTTKATTTITGLESGKRIWFRHRSVTKDGPAAYDGPVDIIIP